MGAMIAKAIYTAVTIGLIAMLARELWNVWFDRGVYVGTLDFTSEDGKDDKATHGSMSGRDPFCRTSIS